jgi:hypothetical protein
MAKNSKVTEIVDRYEATFVVFYRDHSRLGRIYYRPSEHSIARFARALQSSGAKTYSYKENPRVYLFKVAYQ